MQQEEKSWDFAALTGKWPVAVAFAVSALLLVAATRDASLKAQSVVGAEARNTTAYARITHLAAVLVAATNAETCSHGYVITGDAGFLTPYERALDVQNQMMAELEVLYSGDVARAALLRGVRDALTTQRQHMNSAVARRRTADGIQAEALIAGFRGRELTDSVRAAVRMLVVDEQSALTRERAVLASATSAGTRASLVYASVGFMAVTLGFVVFIRQRRRNALAALPMWEGTPVPNGDQLLEVSREMD